MPPDGTRVAAPDLDLMFISSERAAATGAAATPVEVASTVAPTEMDAEQTLEKEIWGDFEFRMQ